MADEKKEKTEDIEEAEESGATEDIQEESTQKNKVQLKKLIIVGIAGIVLFGLILGVLGFMGVFQTVSDDKEGKVASREEETGPRNMVIYEMPGLLVNLKSPLKGRTPYLKLSLGLEMKVERGDPTKNSEKDKGQSSESLKREIQKYDPLIRDQFYTYLRGLEASDLQGSAGMMRLREELLDRANAVVSPFKFTNILFLEFLIQ